MPSALGPASDPFVHLHVASGYSLQYGASAPHTLVERAAEHGMDTLALTDRDGVYGAVRFVLACRAAGVRPVLGVDLAVTSSGLLPPGAGSTARSAARPAARSMARTPLRGGATVDPRHPRVTLLAQDGRGWASLCRLVSATHLAGERGSPVTTLDLVAEYAGAGGLLVLLGPSSEVGRALAARRPDLAAAVLRRWRSVLPTGDLVVEAVHHRGPGDVALAARLTGLAGEQGLPAVLTNAVRYADRSGAPVADVLDASRRLVALDIRHVDRVNAEGYLKSGKEMHRVADEVATAAGLGPSGAATALTAATRTVAERCALDPRADLGIGEPHFPELDVVDSSGRPAGVVLRERCEAGLTWRGMPRSRGVLDRLESELDVIGRLGYPAYFLTVADVVDLIRDMGVRVAARGSGAGSLVNYLLGVSGVDPIEQRLLMERFLSPLREALPDVDVDVESARRTEVYERILERYGGERCACVSMRDTYRVRHAIRDVGAALGLPPGEVDSLAKAFPHIRARDARAALRELPELRASRIGQGQFDLLFDLVERLDGLPRHIALHPCGVLLSDLTLLDRTPVEASWLGFPMSQFDKDDVEHLGLLKLDVLGIRMQSAMAHAVSEARRVDGAEVDLDDRSSVPLDDPATFDLICSTKTLGCFQIESPGQRELVGKFAPETFGDLVIDISLFRPGPVKSDMVTPFLKARQGWAPSHYIHDSLVESLQETCGVVVFHEQVIEIVAVTTGCSLAEADEVRRALGEPEGQGEVRAWFYPRALARGYALRTVEEIWAVLKAFASFGFCKAHAAAFALPTYQSAWLKAHHTAAFLAGVLTHDPGMYPKRLILDDARQFGIAVLPLDVNASDTVYRVEKVGPTDDPPPQILGQPGRAAPEPGLPDARAYGIRLSLADVKGMSDAESARTVAGRPYGSLADFWHRARASRPVVERLVVAGAFDALYGISSSVPVRRRGRVTRRDLLLQVAELDAWSRAVDRGSGRSRTRGRRQDRIQSRDRSQTQSQDRSRPPGPGEGRDVRSLAARQSQAAAPVTPAEQQPVQLALDLGDAPDAVKGSGLPEMTGAERVRAELEVLGLDASRHIVDFYAGVLDALRVTRSRELLRRRSRAEILVAGVKVATQTPPVRSGRRVIFVTLDDATGPVDATFFEDAQGPYAATLFHSWLLVVRGLVRRTGPRGISLQATGCWDLTALADAWQSGGLDAVTELMAEPGEVTEQAITGAAESRSTRPVMTRPPTGAVGEEVEEGTGSAAGSARRRRVLVHPSGFRQSPYADVRPPGEDTKTAPRKLWHSSPGSAGG
ncbi:MAG: DNA polymerase III subunit alpha [Actinomycetes bacterium]